MACSVTQASEAALSKSFTPEAVAGVAVDAADLNADLHASQAYRAHLITGGQSPKGGETGETG
jgi:CO/xanthine dehydrogenase FAD-binding subunit